VLDDVRLFHPRTVERGARDFLKIAAERKALENLSGKISGFDVASIRRSPFPSGFEQFSRVVGAFQKSRRRLSDAKIATACAHFSSEKAVVPKALGSGGQQSRSGGCSRDLETHF
jgi:hypothetical protein